MLLESPTDMGSFQKKDFLMVIGECDPCQPLALNDVK